MAITFVIKSPWGWRPNLGQQPTNPKSDSEYTGSSFYRDHPGIAQLLCPRRDSPTHCTPGLPSPGSTHRRDIHFHAAMPSIASLLRPSKSTSNLKAAAASSSSPPQQFNAFQNDIVKRPFLTLATPSAGTPSTPVSTSLLSASLKCLESEIPEPFYSIRTKEHLSVIWRRDFRLGRVKVGSVRWPRRGGYGHGQGPSSDAQDDRVCIRFAGREYFGVESLLDPPSKSGSRCVPAISSRHRRPRC